MDDASGHPVRVLLVEEDSGRVEEVLGVLQGDPRFLVRVVPSAQLRQRTVFPAADGEPVDLLLVGLERVDSLALGLFRAAHPNSRTIGYAAPEWPGRTNLTSAGIRAILDWPLTIDALWLAWSAPRTAPGTLRMDQALARLQAQSSQIAQHLKRLQGAAAGAPQGGRDQAAPTGPAPAVDAAAIDGAPPASTETEGEAFPTVLAAREAPASTSPTDVAADPAEAPDPEPDTAMADPAPVEEGARDLEPDTDMATPAPVEQAPDPEPAIVASAPVEEETPAPVSDTVASAPEPAIADSAPAPAADPLEAEAAPFTEEEEGDIFPDSAPALPAEDIDPTVLDRPPRQPGLIPTLLQRRDRHQASSGYEDDPFYLPPPAPAGRDWAPGVPTAPGSQPPNYDYSFENAAAARAAARAAEQAVLIAKQAVDVVQGAMANPQLRARIESAADNESTPPVPHPYFRPPRPIVTVRRSDPDQGLVLAIYSPKGGTGCSTLAANLAVCLSQVGVSTALVDGHRSFGSVDVLLQLDPQGSSVMSFVDEPDIQPTHVLEALTPHASGVRSLLAPLQPEQGERVTSEIYQQVLGQLCRHFICTIVDLPADYDPCTMSIIQRADRLLVPTGPDLPALKALDRFLSYADDLPGVRERLDLVLIRANSVPAEHVAYLEEQLGQQFTHRVISDGRRTTLAANRGAPFVLSAPDAPISKDIRSIAQWLTHLYLEPRARILWMAQEARLGGRW